MFYAKVRVELWKTGEVVKSKSLVYVIEGNIVLVSRAVLEMLGCIPRHFPRVGEFLEADDKALTGKSFAVFRGKGMSEEKAANEAVDRRTESTKTISHGPGSQRGLGKGGSLVGSTTPPEPSPLRGPGYSTHSGMEGQLAGNNKTRPAVRQPMGECDNP